MLNKLKKQQNLFLLSILVLTCFILSISILYLVNDWFLVTWDAEKLNNPLFWKNFDLTGNKIYLLGDSSVNRIDDELVEKILNEQGHDFRVIDLGVPASQPVDRLPVLDKIISTKPKFVVIAIGPNSLHNYNFKIINNQGIFDKPQKPFFDPQSAFQSFLAFNDIPYVELYNFKNPKLTSMKLIKILKSDYVEPILNSTNDFFLKQSVNFASAEPSLSQNVTNKEKIVQKGILGELEWDPHRPATDEELKYMIHDLNLRYASNIPVENNLNHKAIEFTIERFTESNIHVIILVMPRHQIWLDTMPPEQMNNFNHILEKLHETTGVSVYSLLTKYSDQPMFQDQIHIAIHPNSNIFHEEVARIILHEIQYVI